MNTNRKKKINKSYETARKVFKDLKISPTLGQVVRSLRECDEVSQIHLAEELGVSRQFLSDVEHDRKIVGV
jgi:predicted transcriptional regulator